MRIGKSLKIVTFIFVLHTKLVFGQDMQFTQFYASSIYLNPAFTGANVCSRVSLTYRNQWPGVKKTYQSYMISMDHYLQPQHVGIGLLFAADQAGSGALKTTIISPSFAYEAKITKTFAIRAGIQPAVVIKSIDFDKLVFGDQISRGGNTGASSVATVETPTQTKAFFDINAGVLLYTAKYWGGFSVSHLTTPNESFYESADTKLPMKLSVHGGAKFSLNEDEKDSKQKKYISTALHYRSQGKFDQFDIGVYYSQSIFNLGFWYRGIPGLKAYKPGYSNHDAISFIVGLQAERVNVGYSYDITISKLAGSTQGAHEITMSYQLCNPKKKVKARVVVACPKF
jgi:type IX secretion system PorP/SprF family membrane protein